MISVSKDVSYRNIEERSSIPVLYTDFLSEKAVDKIVKYVHLENPLIVEILAELLLRLTGNFYQQKRLQKPKSIVYIYLKEAVFTAEDTKTKNKIEHTCPKGAVLVLGKKFVQRNEVSSASTIRMYEYDEILPEIYLTIEKRLAYARKVNRELKMFKDEPIWNQCLKKYVNMSYLGKGCYGNVYQVKNKFAIKIAKLKEEAVEHPFDPDISSWHELYFLKNIIRTIVANKICPNLPLIYDSFTCGKCILKIEDNDVESPCAIAVVELAQGTLKAYLKENKPTLDETHSMYFQILAGLSAIQYYGQIMNFDVKKENVLYYKVKPGGYWHYRIRGKDFYVPNYGHLFVLNDFGISRSLSPGVPLYKTKEDDSFRLGLRYARVENGVFVPIIAEKQINEEGEEVKPNQVVWLDKKKRKTTGAEFRMDRKGNLLSLKTIPKITINMLMDPDTIPPFEFYNDVQDTIRMFTGEKRTTQNGNHSSPSNIPKEFLKQLSLFSGKGVNAKDGKFSTDPAQVIASYLLVAFFEKFTTYREKKTHIIESFLFPPINEKSKGS